jgi:hypothetical protein
VLPKSLAEVTSNQHYVGVTFRLKKGETKTLVVFSDQWDFTNKTLIMTIKYQASLVDTYITLSSAGGSPKIFIIPENPGRFEVRLDAETTINWPFDQAKYEIVSESGATPNQIRELLLEGKLILTPLERRI